MENCAKYRHFRIVKNQPGVVFLKTAIDGDETKVQLLKRDLPFGKKNRAFRLPSKIAPKGLSLKRQWYLYEQIRMHIPNEPDQNMTCPKPKKSKPKT